MDATYTLSVIVPCYNEEGNVAEFTQRLMPVFKSLNITGEIVFVNDGSRDQTAALLQEQANLWPANVVALNHPTNLGIEQGWATGIQAARGEFVCIIDADLQYKPEDVELLFREIKSAPTDIIQGARNPVDELKGTRYVLSKGLNLILNFVFNMRLKDNKSGFLLMKRQTFADIIHHRFRYRYYQSLICVAAAKRGYQIRGIDVVFEKRYSGSSFMTGFPVKVIVGCLSDIVKGYCEFVLLARTAQPPTN